MTFKESLAADLDTVFFDESVFADVAIYAGKSILVIQDSGQLNSTSIPGVLVPGKRIMVRASDVAKPKQGDKVTLSGATWHVVGMPIEEGGVWTLDLDQETRRVGV